MAFSNVLQSIFSALFVASILRISTPIILPALGGLISDLSGATNISLEGTMLVAAFTGVVVSAYTESVLLGVIGGILSGLLIAVILGIFHLHLKTDIFLAGIAINIMATGGTVLEVPAGRARPLRWRGRDRRRAAACAAGRSPGCRVQSEAIRCAGDGRRSP